MEGGAWKATIHGVAKSRTRLHFTSFLRIGDSGHPEGRAVAELSLWQVPENNCEISE